MATISFLIDRNASMDFSSVGITETDNSGVTMTKGIEINVDKSKITSKMEILEALDILKKAIVQTSLLTG